MTKEQAEFLAMELSNVGMALSQIEVKGESNLNLLLASIQSVRKVKKCLKEGEYVENHNGQKEDV